MMRVLAMFFLACAAAAPAMSLAAAGQAPREVLTREEALRTLERHGASEIVFAVRGTHHEHWYANFAWTAYGTDKALYDKAGRLCRLNLKTGEVKNLLEDAEGAFRDPCVDYDGKKIIFSWRKEGSQHYHLYDINADGTGLRQLTDGGYDDIEPSTLPDGGIVFVSSRCQRYVNCWISQVATIYRCDRDGKNIRQLSANVEQDNTPWVLPDGRILYTRWEYVDRSQVNYHHLWTMNPDGTAQTVYFGNQHPSGVYIDAKPIPGTGRVVMSLSPGHGQMEHGGKIATVDDNRGPDAGNELKAISPETSFRDPWALDAEHFLAARDRKLVMLNDAGSSVTLFKLEGQPGDVWLHEPRPLAPRKREPVIPSRVHLAQPTGKFMLVNVNQGRNMEGIKPEEIKKLLVLQSLPKPVNFTGGMDPLSYVGTFTLERVLGTVPVEPDGSAYFEAPALQSLIFVALDEKDAAIKRMQSFTTVQPGETLGCVGCHEPRTMAGAANAPQKPLAAGRTPSRIEPVAGIPDVLDFPRDIQPILNRHCLKCHDVDKRRGGVLLTGDRGPMFSHGYYSLVVWGQVADGRNLAKSNYGPRQLGSGGSKLMQKLEGGHHGVKVTPRERRTAQLWIDSGAPYPGTYASLGTGMIGGYEVNQEVLENDETWPEARDAVTVFGKRCASCHAGEAASLPKYLADENELSFWQPRLDDPRLKRSRHIVYNLTRPDKSLFLLAPLARDAGGYGLCRAKGAEPHPGIGVFSSTKDEGYRALLAMIKAGQRRLKKIKRFDMRGFKPRGEYVRELKRYGVLPPTLNPERDKLDVYATDRKYWDSFTLRGKEEAQKR